MATAVRRYAVAQARLRARLAQLADRRTLEGMAAAPDAEAVQRTLEARGRPDSRDSVLAAFDDAAAMLEGTAREVVVRYRDRHESENLAVLLRAAERGLDAEDALPLLQPVGALGRAPLARALVQTGSLAGAVALLPAEPYGDLLRRVVAASPRGAAPRVRLEAVAEREAWERVFAAVSALGAADRRSALRVLGTKLDCVHVLRFLRLRAEQGLAGDEVLALAPRGGHLLGRRERAVLAHEPPAEWAGRLAHTPYAGALASAGDAVALEAALRRVVAAAARRELAGTPFRIGLVLAYLVLVELQADDLRRVLEGRRLRRSAEWVCAGLASARSA